MAERRAAALARKRREYRDLVAAHYAAPAAELSDGDAATLRQIGAQITRAPKRIALLASASQI